MQVNHVRLGLITVEWPEDVEWPIAVDHVRPDGEKPFVTTCAVTYHAGSSSWVVPKRYFFDGASIPKRFAWLPGFQRLGWHLMAALVHDASCDSKIDLPRSMGDAMFLEMLLAIADKRQRRARSPLCRLKYSLQGWLMFFAVSLYGSLKRAKTRRARIASYVDNGEPD